MLRLTAIPGAGQLLPARLQGQVWHGCGWEAGEYPERVNQVLLLG